MSSGGGAFGFGFGAAGAGAGAAGLGAAGGFGTTFGSGGGGAGGAGGSSPSRSISGGGGIGGRLGGAGGGVVRSGRALLSVLSLRLPSPRNCSHTMKAATSAKVPKMSTVLSRLRSRRLRRHGADERGGAADV